MSKNKTLLRIISFVILLVVIFIIIYVYKFKYLKNFTEVIPGVLYRSAQPDLNYINYWHDKYKIRSILNLRGDRYHGERKDEFDFAKENNITIFSAGISSNHLPEIQNMREIIDFLLSAPKPLLVHCLHGVDRTSLVTAIALLLNNYSIDDAEKAFSITNGFLPFRAQEELRGLLTDYGNWLDNNNLHTNKDNFIYWSKNVYSPINYSFDLLKYKSGVTLEHGKNITLPIKIKNEGTNSIELMTSNKQGLYLMACLKKDLEVNKGKSCIELAHQEEEYKVTRKNFAVNCAKLDHTLYTGESIVADCEIETYFLDKDKYIIEIELIDRVLGLFSKHFDGDFMLKVNLDVV